MNHWKAIVLICGLHFYGCVLNKCEVMTVVDKAKCTFDRDVGERVCVAKLGKIENRAIKTIRGNTISTKLPEPLDPYITEVEVCMKEGKRIFNKL